MFEALFLASLLQGATSPPISNPETLDKPNILVVILDDASREEFQQPQMDKLQALMPTGRLFKNFYTSTVCSPTRYQLQFGRYPFRAGIGKALGSGTAAGAAADETSIAEVLQAEGYATGLFGKWHINGANSPLVIEEAPRIQGFQTWQAGSIGNIPDGMNHFLWPRIDDGVSTTSQTYSSDAIYDAWEQWWLQPNVKPKFGVLSYLAPHSPFDHPLSGAIGANPSDILKRRNYEGALDYIDEQIHDLFSIVNLEETFVFVLSDNGTPPQVKPPNGLEAGYKTTPFEGGIHVPLGVWGPDVLPGVDFSMVQAADLSATLLELCSADPSSGFDDSISFRPSLFQSDLPSARAHVFSQRFSPNFPDPDVVLPIEFNEWAIVRQDGFKLCHLKQQPIGTPSSPGSSLFRLYHLPSDPFESTDLYDEMGFGAIQDDLEQVLCGILGLNWSYLPDECTTP